MKANTIEIPLEFKNYKLLKNNKFDLSGSYIYFIEASCNKGKTSLKDCIASIMCAKNLVDEPVTRGESDGYVEGMLPGADGKIYAVRFSFNNDESKFVVIDDQGNKISKVSDIRSIFKYTHFTAEEFLSMSLTADGRREQVKIMLNLLTSEEKSKYTESKINEKTLYDKRQVKYVEYDTARKIVNEGQLTGPEEELLAKKEEIDKSIKLRQEQIKTFYANKEKTDLLEKEIKNIKYSLELISKKFSDATISKKVVKLTSDLDSLTKESNENFTDKEGLTIAELEVRLNNGSKYRDDIVKLEQKKETYLKYLSNYAVLEKEYNDLCNEVESERQKQKDIIKNSTIPIENLTIDDDGISIDGFSFKESQICKSSAIKVIAGIMCKINPAPVLLMGSAGDLDDKSLNQLLEVAKENNKIMIFDYVVRTEQEIQVVGYDKTDVEKQIDTEGDGLFAEKV
jgi:hypothetical protein